MNSTSIVLPGEAPAIFNKEHTSFGYSTTLNRLIFVSCFRCIKHLPCCLLQTTLFSTAAADFASPPLTAARRPNYEANGLSV